MQLFDANVFIEAKNRYYAFDINPGFWDWIEDAHGRTEVATIDKVADEIAAGKDELKDWFKAMPPTFAIPFDIADQPYVAQLGQWAVNQGFTQAAISDFMGSADLFLIAKAAADNHVIVSHETIVDPNAKTRVKIPNACAEVGVECITIYEALRRDNAPFTYRSPDAAGLTPSH